MKSLFSLIAIFIVFSAVAQPAKGKNTGKGEIFGRVVDSLSNEPLPYVTVLALNQETDKLIKGAVTTENGNFSVTDIPFGVYRLKISFAGYETAYLEDIKLSDENATLNIKDFQMAQPVLKTVEVIGGEPDITFEIDKKVINVEDQINAEGQSALEILENVPSVTVNPDGTVTLRGSSSFTLLIDGVPTILDPGDALATLPAGSIKDIEIITNPSAKFDAEGTSGVINIITKKSKLEGISCLINGNAGTFNNYGGDIALNLKKKAFTFDVNANINRRGRPSDRITERTTFYDSVTNVLISEGEGNWKRQNWGVGGAMQWKPNNSHVLVLRTNYTSTLMEPYSDEAFKSYDDGVLVEEFQNENHNNIDIASSSTSLFYQHNIKRNKKHYISVKAIANLRDVVQADTTLSYLSDGDIRSGNLYTETGPSNSFRFNVDYSLPLKKDRKFEAGLQSQLGESGDIGRNYRYNSESSAFEFDPLYSFDVDYTRDVHAAYTMFNGKRKRLGYQVGLRAEYTYREISSSNAAQFTTINRLDWFPSAHFSYSLKNKSQFLISYARRIERPRSYYFEPFVTWEGPFNVRSGNPNLQPEYINAFELGYMYPLKRKGFFSAEMYYRQSNNIINRISTVYDEGVLISQPYNIGTSQSLGLENSLSYTLKDWWKINAGTNLYLYNLDGSLEGVDYSAQSFNYSGRLTNTFNFKKVWTVQLVSRYRSGSVTAQGRNLDSFVQDITVKRLFFKKKLSLALQGRNVFGTARRGGITYTENVIIDQIARPLTPQLMLTASLKLNNYQKVFERNEQMDDF